MNIVLWIALAFLCLALAIVVAAAFYYNSSRPKADDWGGLILAVYSAGFLGIVSIVLGAIGLVAKLF